MGAEQHNLFCKLRVSAAQNSNCIPGVLLLLRASVGMNGDGGAVGKSCESVGGVGGDYKNIGPTHVARSNGRQLFR